MEDDSDQSFQTLVAFVSLLPSTNIMKRGKNLFKMKKSTILLTIQCSLQSIYQATSFFFFLRLNMPDQLHDKTECSHVCDNFMEAVETECWELSHLRLSLHLHAMKMTA